MNAKQETLNRESLALEQKQETLNWLEKGREKGSIILFNDSTPVPGHLLEANQNSVDAVEYFILSGEIDSKEPLGIIGSMGCGKTTFFAEVYGALVKNGKRVRVYMHDFDGKRSGDKRKLWTQGGESGISTNVEVNSYNKIDDLLDEETGIPWDELDVVMIDEFMFNGESTEDPPKANEQMVQKLFDKAKQHGVKLIISLLHSDYRGEMWPNMKTIINHINKFYEFHGRCDKDGCSNPSVLTSRKTVISETKGVVIRRPSHRNEKVLRPGTVLNGKQVADPYFRSCVEDQEVMSAQEAKIFDQKHGIDMGDYRL